MKKTLISIAVFTLATGYAMTSQARLEKGTREVGLQGSLDLDAADDYLLNLDFKYGYFMRDNWEVGANLAGTSSDTYKKLNIGLFTEYNFNNGSNWVPFVGAAALLATADYDESRKGGLADESNIDITNLNALSIDLTLGFKYFVNDNVSISAGFTHTISTDDIHFNGKDIKDSASNILFGTRFYF